MIEIDIVLYDGFDALDAIGPWEVLRKAESCGAPLSTQLVASEGEAAIVSSDGLHIGSYESLDRRHADWILVPGGAWATRTPRGAWGEVQRGRLPEIFRTRRAQGTGFASVCTGAMILSAAGITKGRDVTTHEVAKSALRAEGANVIDARVVDDGDLVTSAGVTNGIDLALWLVERLASPEIAARVTRVLEWQRATSVHHGPRSNHAARALIANAPRINQ